MANHDDGYEFVTKLNFLSIIWNIIFSSQSFNGITINLISKL